MSSILIYGSPGSGKTTAATTFHKLGYKIHILDMDKKVRHMQNLKFLIDTKKASFWESKANLLSEETTLRERVLAGPKQAPKVQPQGYLEFVDQINELTKNPLPDHEKTVLVVDSMTKVLEHLKRLILQMQGKSDLEYRDWGFILANLEEFFDKFFGLQALQENGKSLYPHCIVIAHDQVDQDQVTGRMQIKPLIDGSMRNKVGAYVEEMYYAIVEVNREGKAEYKMLTKPLGRVSQARTSRLVETYMPADFSKIFEGEKFDG